MTRRIIALGVAAAICAPVFAQTAPDSGQRGGLTVGGYGEVALSRNFYSDNVYRYSSASSHAGEQHGRFDIPHAVVYLSYDFGKGWKMQTEIEFEHTGTGGAVEKEFEEAGEWETEVEKGGEVELEQFWIEKSFSPAFNVRMGHMVVPVGGLNNAHEPLNFFTVYRSEGEYTILPSTWHDTGVSIWGRTPHWRYEAQVIAGLDAYMFSTENFVKYGAGSPFEFKAANQLGLVGRVDNYSVKNLRLSLSGFYGRSFNNTYPYEEIPESSRYYGVKGRTAIGAFDFAYNGARFVARGNADYGYVGDAYTISNMKRNRTANNAPYKKSAVGRGAVAAGVEAGYDILPWFGVRPGTDKLFVFGRYEYYNSYIPAAGEEPADWTARHRIALGVNWLPIPQIAVKAEYSHRFLKAGYNPEPSINIGVCYMAYFNKK
ncbi:MAG: hypothetical protein IJP39_07455 [Bacteroidales bacterium]|nr:hypothetical protein [Bacteroidales bacterium]MBQ6822233.1 hypothetical protein [Bacteroidales bacterium]MBR0030515.1 hypothetical protein [Bacteroidales bacterium]MBR0083098.1 hypothetical protein [Bacteroidales bacterium]